MNQTHKKSSLIHLSNKYLFLLYDSSYAEAKDIAVNKGSEEHGDVFFFLFL